MLYSYNPLRIFVESIGLDADGYGQMTVSSLNIGLAIPLMRYQTGDTIRLLNSGKVVGVAHRHGIPLPAALPPTLLALKGRDSETLPNRSHVGVYKDALYADWETAEHLTGAFRLVFSRDRFDMHVQLRSSSVPDLPMEQAMRLAIPSDVQPETIVLWPYGRFPFGIGLDYERKFTYYRP